MLSCYQPAKDLGQYVAQWLLQENVQIGAADQGYSEALLLKLIQKIMASKFIDKPEGVWDIRPNGETIGGTEELR